MEIIGLCTHICQIIYFVLYFAHTYVSNVYIVKVSFIIELL